VLSLSAGALSSGQAITIQSYSTGHDKAFIRMIGIFFGQIIIDGPKLGICAKPDRYLSFPFSTIYCRQIHYQGNSQGI